jgi:hypothetical protein
LAVEMPTASITGITAADIATERAVTLRIARRPLTRVNAWTGQRHTARTALVQNGPSTATPMAQQRIDGPAVAPASGPVITVAVTISSARPPPRNARPKNSRTQLNHFRCSEASINASTGRIFADLRAAISAAPIAARTAAPAPAANGIRPWANSTTGDATPYEPSWSNRNRPRKIPGTAPSATAGSDTSIASPRIIRRT